MSTLRELWIGVRDRHTRCVWEIGGQPRCGDPRLLDAGDRCANCLTHVDAVAALAILDAARRAKYAPRHRLVLDPEPTA